MPDGRNVERELLSMLARAAADTGLPEVDRWKYGASATEQEIEAGALASCTPVDHVLAFFRSISHLPIDEAAADYVDLLPIRPGLSVQPDTSKRDRLAAMKSALRRRLPKGNVFEHYTAVWIQGPSGGVSRDHLDQLCVDVFTSLARVILAEMSSLQNEDGLQQEIDAHDRFGKERARIIEGRRPVLEVIDTYVRNDVAEPLLIHGPSGGGKSAVMARAAENVSGGLPTAPVVIRRYIGATPDSSTARQLLNGLCRQIAREYGDDEGTVPADMQSLVVDFSKRLELATPDRPLVLILDALDQLDDTDNARSLYWLPVALPPYVRLILSAISDRESPVRDCYDALARRIATASQLELPPLRREDGEIVLRSWFEEATAHRQLQDEQRKSVLDAFSKTGQALHLRLLFEEARRWRSFDQDPTVSDTIPGSIDNLFARLSAPEEHGPLLVELGLAYLAAAKHGLDENEALDLLSGDATLLDSYEASVYHELPDRRVPPVIWSRFAFDLRPYLTERLADGVVLLTFFHRQLRDAVEQSYLTGMKMTRYHRALAEYFKGQSLDIGIVGVPHQIERLQYRLDEIAETLRNDTVVLTPRTIRFANVRKLSEQPYQQACAEDWAAAFSTLTDFEFLERKTQHSGFVDNYGGITVYAGVYALQDDYAFALGRLKRVDRDSYKRRRIIVTAVDANDGKDVVIRCPHCGKSSGFDDSYRGRDFACPNILCRGPLHANRFIVGESALNVPASAIARENQHDVSELQRFRKIGEAFLRSLRREANTLSLRPDLMFQQLYNRLQFEEASVADIVRYHASTRGAPHHRQWVRTRVPFRESNCLLASLKGHADSINDCAISADASFIVSASEDNTLKIWDASTGRERTTLVGHTGGVTSCAISPDGRFIVSTSLWGAEPANDGPGIIGPGAVFLLEFITI